MSSRTTIRCAQLVSGTIAAALALAACGGNGTDGPTVTVYLGRQYGIEPVFEQFSDETGITVEFTGGSDPELRERLLAEGANSPADVVITADAANIELAADAGLLAPLNSPAIDAAIPEELRSDDDLWTALSQRARSVIYSTERVVDPPTTYAGVGDPMWKGRLCLRPSTHPYTQSLVADLVINLGVDQARQVVESWVGNDPLYINSDTDIYKAVANGECDIAIANSYYLGRLQTEDPNFPVAISWTEQETTGTHVNISAAGIAKNAPNPDGARTLVEWLATTGQESFASANFEYPADPDVPTNELVASWGTFTADLAAIRLLGATNATAIEVLSASGYE